MHREVNIATGHAGNGVAFWLDLLAEQGGQTNGARAFDDLPFLPIGMADGLRDFYFTDQDKLIYKVLGNIEGDLIIKANTAPQRIRQRGFFFHQYGFTGL